VLVLRYAVGRRLDQNEHWWCDNRKVGDAKGIYRTEKFRPQAALLFNLAKHRLDRVLIWLDVSAERQPQPILPVPVQENAPRGYHKAGSG
jgi:hypothetical protein